MRFEKLIPFFLVMILLSVSVQGTISSNPADYLQYDDFNRADNTNLGSSGKGTAWIEGANTLAEIYSNELNVTGTRVWADLTDYAYIPYNLTINPTIVTYMIEWEVPSTIPTTFVELKYDTNDRCQWRPFGGDFIYLNGVGNVDTLQNYIANTKYNLSSTFNSTSDLCQFGINSSSINYTSAWDTDHESLTGTYGSIAGQNLGATAILDNLKIWNGTYSNMPQASPIPDTLNLSIPTPLNDYQSDTNLMDFNLTANASSVFDCRFYVNGTLNQSDSFVNGTNIPIGFSETFPTGSYSYNISCNTTTTNESTTTNNFYVDSVDPIIGNITNPEGLVFFQNNLTGQFNLTDNFYLHSINASVDGVGIEYISELNTTQYTYNLSYDVSGLSPGNHILGLRLADGHTARELGGDYEIDTGWWDRYITYEFWDEGSVTITGMPDSIFDKFTTEKQTDRYVFAYEPSEIQDTYTFEVESEDLIYIVDRPESKYQSFIITGDHWMDWYMPSEPNMKVIITKVDNYKVEVSISGLANPEFQQYNSIGDLNIVTQNYTFVTTNMTHTYSSSINEMETQTISLLINTTALTNTNATLTWNGTNKTVTKSVGADYDLYSSTFLTPQIDVASQQFTINWTYNISTAIGSETGNITVNQTVYQIGIDNCSVYTTNAINISLKDEETDVFMTGDIDGYFEVWISSISDYRSFNLTWDGSNNYSICIDPAGATYQAYAQLEYTATDDDYITKNYYFTNTTLNNVTDLLTLYFTNQTTTVTLSVTDQNDNPIESAYIYVQSYDLGTDSYKTTEIAKTDFNGDALAEMILNTQWYKFMIVYDGETVLETSPKKLTSASLNFRINLVSDYYGNYDKVQGVTCAITFNNATNNFRMVFNDPTGNVATGTLVVKKMDTYGDEIVNSSSLSSSSGTLLVGIVETNNTYLGIGTITIEGDDYACGNPYAVDFSSEWETWGTEGVMLAMLLTLTMVMVAIWHPVVAIVFMVIGVGLSIILGSLYISMPVLIGFIVVAGVAIYRLNK